MGISTALPLFRMSGFGPLGLPLTTQAYGIGLAPLSEPGNSQSGTAGAFLASGPSTGLVAGSSGGGRNRLFAAAADGTDGRSSSNPVPKTFVLNFLLGESRKSSFALEEGREIVIGREAGLDVVLTSDRVAKRHVKISVKGGHIQIQDLGSVAGTFVNGSKVNRTELKEGDRIMIGAAILRLDAASGEAPASSPSKQNVTARPPASPVPPSRPSQPSQKVSGMIEEIPLPDMLQLMAASKKTGVFVIDSERGVGKIYLKDGRVSHCTINDSTVLKPQKAFYRMLGWTHGVFNLEPPFAGTLPHDINASVESLLMEGVYESDEVRRLEADAPKPGSKLAPNLHVGRLRDLSPEELDVFQLVLTNESLEDVLDNFAGSDLQAYTQLIALMQKGFVIAS